MRYDNTIKDTLHNGNIARLQDVQVFTLGLGVYATTGTRRLVPVATTLSHYAFQTLISSLKLTLQVSSDLNNYNRRLLLLPIPQSVTKA